MKITFIKDCPPIPACGNSFYAEGTEADLPRAGELIQAGYACEGWGVASEEDTAVSDSLASHSYRDLQKLAKSYGIPANKSKDELIQSLNEAINGDN